MILTTMFPADLNSAKVAGLVGSGALAGHFLLERLSPFYHRMRIPYKVFGVAGIVTVSRPDLPSNRSKQTIYESSKSQYGHQMKRSMCHNSSTEA